MATAAKKKTWGPQLESHQIVIRPLLTEKGTHMATRMEREADRKGPERHGAGKGKRAEVGNSYQFEVHLLADKAQIKAALEDLFSVRVLKVRTQNRLGKQRRYRNRFGRLPNWKKAIVTLHKDDHLEFF